MTDNRLTDSYNGFYLSVKLALKFIDDLGNVADKNRFRIKQPNRVNKLKAVISDLQYLNHDMMKDEQDPDIKDFEKMEFKAQKLRRLFERFEEMDFNALAGLTEIVDGILDKNYTAVLIKDEFVDDVVTFVKEEELKRHSLT